MGKLDTAAFESNVLDAVRRENMIKEGDNLIVALSGGADSMALLYFLVWQREQLGIGELTAVHINHCLRGAESQRDESFVINQCRRLGVPLKVYSVDVQKEAADSGEGLEEAGRRVRYEYLSMQAAKLCASVATAHTKSDNVETLLLNITRGSGLHGLCGIPAIRNIEYGGASISVIRPLLYCTRAQVESYCRDKSIEYIHDSSNDDIYFARNRIRLNVVPELKKINADVETAASRLMGIIRADSQYLDSLAKKALHESEMRDEYGGYDALALDRLPLPLRTRALKLAVGLVDQKAALGLSQRHVSLMQGLLKSGGALALFGGLEARVTQGRFLLWNRHQDDILTDEAEIELKIGISCTFYGRIYRPALLSLDVFEKQQKIHKNLLKYSLNYDKISGQLILRGRRPGDAYRPAGRNVKKTLKKLFNEHKIPAVMRDTVPVICDEHGIVLVCGIGCDERVLIDASCRRVMVLESV